jgi:hypothetical protein
MRSANGHGGNVILCERGQVWGRGVCSAGTWLLLLVPVARWSSVRWFRDAVGASCAGLDAARGRLSSLAGVDGLAIDDVDGGERGRGFEEVVTAAPAEWRRAASTAASVWVKTSSLKARIRCVSSGAEGACSRACLRAARSDLDGLEHPIHPPGDAGGCSNETIRSVGERTRTQPVLVVQVLLPNVTNSVDGRCVKRDEV